MNTNTNSQEPRAEARREEGDLASNLVGLGTAWARYGLRIGSVALEANSKHVETCGKLLGSALASTAKALENLADSLANDKAKTDVIAADEHTDSPHPS